MRNWVVGLVLVIAPSLAFGWNGARPKLIVVMVIDQFRADFMSRYQKELRPDGFKALIREGAYYPTAEYDILQAMTAPGHATVLSGAYPYQMGIPINEWYSQEKHATEYCVEDAAVKQVGSRLGSKDGKETKGGISPKNFKGTTLGDELKGMDPNSRVVALAIKDRAAVLLGGKRANIALWLSKATGTWITSSYYRADEKIPAWMEVLNQQVPAKDKCDWGKACGVEQTVRAAKAALLGEKLGQRLATDILAISFSSHDMLGHDVGPNSPHMRGITLAEDKAVADLRLEIAKRIPGGLKNVVFVLTGDHGVAPVPEEAKALGLDAGRFDEVAFTKKANSTLDEKFGRPKKGEWIAMAYDFNFYLDEDSARASKVKLEDLENTIKALAVKEDAFAHVFTRSEYDTRVLPPGVFERRAMRTYVPGRSGHVVGLPKPGYIDGINNHRANHMTSYTYDRMVPLIISGFGMKPGLYAEKAEVVDIAPTLAFLLGVLPPALSEGRVLSEALKTTKR